MKQTHLLLPTLRLNIKSALLLAVSCLVFLVLTQNTYAQSFSLTPVSLGTHPQAAAQPAAGRPLLKLEIFDGKIYAGYGSWNSNTGPIAVNPFNIAGSNFEGTEYTAPTEAITTWRIINGKLYIPMIDAQGCALCSTGYAVLDPGSPWNMKSLVTAEHVFDVATLDGNDLWLFGSSNMDSATAWRSTNNETSFNIVQTRTNQPGISNTERYYWGMPLGGKMYMQSFLSNNPIYYNPIQIFNGSGWDTPQNYYGSYVGPGTVCEEADQSPVTFQGYIICAQTYSTTGAPPTSMGSIVLYDGTSEPVQYPSTDSFFEETSPPAFTNCMPTDSYVTATYYYLLCGETTTGSAYTKKVIRSSNLTNWQELTGMPNGSRSLVVDEVAGMLYIGTNDSQIFAAQLPPEPTPPTQVASASSTTQGSLAKTGAQADSLLILVLLFIFGAITSFALHRQLSKV